MWISDFDLLIIISINVSMNGERWVRIGAKKIK